MAETPSDIVAQRVRDMRRRLGLTAGGLAARCAGIGAPQITAQVITNLETGRRDASGRRVRGITVDELLVLAAALDVPPPYLLAPLTGDGILAITPSLEVDGLGASRWLCGEQIPVAFGAPARAEIAFRRAQRPLNVLQRAWMAADALSTLREAGKKGTQDYRALLGHLARHLDELDGLLVPAPPLPRWLTSDLESGTGG